MSYVGGILSDQVKIYMGSAPATNTLAGLRAVTDYTWIQQLQSTPAMGGTKTKVDVTCLEDTFKRNINGLTDYGDSIDFSFLYDLENYTALKNAGEDNNKSFKVELKTGERFYFVGRVSLSMNEIAVDNALTFTASIAPQSEIFFDTAAVSNMITFSQNATTLTIHVTGSGTSKYILNAGQETAITGGTATVSLTANKANVVTVTVTSGGEVVNSTTQVFYGA